MFRLIHAHWHAHLVHVLSLVKEISYALGDEFKVWLEMEWNG